MDPFVTLLRKEFPTWSQRDCERAAELIRRSRAVFDDAYRTQFGIQQLSNRMSKLRGDVEAYAAMARRR